jgi:hypothetical protein
LQAASLGIFGDAAIFPFQGYGLFSGVRVEIFNIGRLAKSSSSEIERQREYDSPKFLAGSAAFLQLGYRFPLTKGFALRIYGHRACSIFLSQMGKLQSTDRISM